MGYDRFQRAVTGAALRGSRAGEFTLGFIISAVLFGVVAAFGGAEPADRVGLGGLVFVVLSLPAVIAITYVAVRKNKDRANGAFAFYPVVALVYFLF
jgi:hypothetical protein